MPRIGPAREKLVALRALARALASWVLQGANLVVHLPEHGVAVDVGLAPAGDVGMLNAGAPQKPVRRVPLCVQ